MVNQWGWLIKDFSPRLVGGVSIFILTKTKIKDMIFLSQQVGKRCHDLNWDNALTNPEDYLPVILTIWKFN